MQVSLKVLRGKSAGKEIPIPVSVFLIGRSDDCHLRPKSDAISRRHCEVTIESDSVWVKDLGSRNGTYVDGEKISDRTEVRNGSELKIGKLAFEVVISAPAAAPEGFDVSDWLANDEAAAEQEQHLADPETRQFKLDETSQDQLKRAGEKVEEVDATVTGEADLDTDTGNKQTIEAPPEEEESTDDTTGFFLSKKKKKDKGKPGKLPSQAGPSTDSSTAAAAETLKKFFNNRS